MDASQLVLYRFIEALDPSLLPAEGDTSEQEIAKRRGVQHIIYLAQVLGDMDLGYRFEWKPTRSPEELKRALDAKLVKELEDAHAACEDVLKKLRARIAFGLGPIELTSNEKHTASRVIVNVEESLWRLQSAAEMLGGARKPAP